MVDHWMKDEHSESCVDCKVKFTIYERKHHCRNCGQVFCSSCSQYQAEIPRLNILQPVRVCKSCHNHLKAKVSKNPKQKRLTKTHIGNPLMSSASNKGTAKKTKSKEFSKDTQIASETKSDGAHVEEASNFAYK